MKWKVSNVHVGVHKISVPCAYQGLFKYTQNKYSTIKAYGNNADILRNKLANQYPSTAA